MDQQKDVAGFKTDYKGYIAIEQLVSRQIDRIMFYRTQEKFSLWEEGVEALIDLLMPEDEKKVLKFMEERNIEHATDPEGRKKYVELFRYMKKLFSDKKIIWKRGGYEIGHD